jgi:hypothetical protein
MDIIPSACPTMARRKLAIAGAIENQEPSTNNKLLTNPPKGRRSLSAGQRRAAENLSPVFFRPCASVWVCG